MHELEVFGFNDVYRSQLAPSSMLRRQPLPHFQCVGRETLGATLVWLAYSTRLPSPRSNMIQLYGVHERGEGRDEQLLRVHDSLRQRADALSRDMPLQVWLMPW